MPGKTSFQKIWPKVPNLDTIKDDKIFVKEKTRWEKRFVLYCIDGIDLF